MDSRPDNPAASWSGDQTAGQTADGPKSDGPKSDRIGKTLFGRDRAGDRGNPPVPGGNQSSGTFRMPSDALGEADKGNADKGNADKGNADKGNADKGNAGPAASAPDVDLPTPVDVDDNTTMRSGAENA